MVTPAATSAVIVAAPAMMNPAFFLFFILHLFLV
jgi:hypothetical protein